MAENTDLVESYLNCHVCSETFRDPVSLSCSHSFCSSCLHKFWKQAKIKNCPICKRKSSKEFPVVNFALKELADNFAGRQKSGSPETEKGEKKVEVVCSKHQEKPKLFCKDEDRVVCTVCEFSLHHGHTVVPVEQAVRDLKEQLKSDLQSLQDKRDKHRRVKETHDEINQHSKKQLLSTESQIRAEFNKLHQFLKEEEESRLAALREEEQQRGKTVSREMKRIQEQISSLSDSISAVEADLQKDSVPFLSSYKASQSRARDQCSLSDPQLLSGALTDVAKHLGNLSFRVWEKMKDKVHFCPVILDPNTAAISLYLSDDLTSVRQGDTDQKLPDNPERYSRYADVLGSEGFSSGKHSWEVEVGDHPRWVVGLAKESADRKGKRYVSPEDGIWCLSHGSGKYTNGSGKSITVKKSLQRIRVQLDYEGGEVSFYNSEDKTHIYTHRDTFTEKLFPCFNIGQAGDAKTAEIKIFPAEISLSGSENSEKVEREEKVKRGEKEKRAQSRLLGVKKKR
ncbi:nuclear factor 7, brain-like [Perca fluviatilis]|uniref:nuclear factor 7, brain-like n=1 Tax=Perca fluviatilis TaxID=8168 RepID=UPI0019638B98|nr:nuclear factor 7, brain-like [Perca fluviatilis]